MKIVLHTRTSTSHSESASIITKAPEGIYLCHTYINEPKVNTVPTMHIHRGTVQLKSKGNHFIGEYYSGRDRGNFGILDFRKG